jgi:hypothetical protein
MNCPFITAEQVARYVYGDAAKPRTKDSIQRWMRRGDLQAYKRGKEWVTTETDVLRWMKDLAKRR